MVLDVYSSGHSLHSKEGVTQRDTPTMISYCRWILLLIHELHAAHPHDTQPWYADDTSVGGNFKARQEHMQEMLVQGPPRGFLPNPTKRILVISPLNVRRSEESFRWMGVRVFTGSHNLGGFINEPLSEKAWLDEKLKGWTD